MSAGCESACCQLVPERPRNYIVPRAYLVQLMPVVVCCVGISDFGGVSPLTRDYVNPESAWPHLRHLCAAAAEAGKTLLPRLPVYPEYLNDADRWLSSEPVKVSAGAPAAAMPTVDVREPPLVCSPLAAVLRASDSSGFARACTWYAGALGEPQDTMVKGATVDATSRHSARAPAVPRPTKTFWRVERGVHGALEGYASPPVSATVQQILHGRDAGRHAGEQAPLADTEWAVDDVVSLLTAYGSSAEAVVRCADALRKHRCGEGVSYVVNRNINYTNVRPRHLATLSMPLSGRTKVCVQSVRECKCAFVNCPVVCRSARSPVDSARLARAGWLMKLGTRLTCYH